jgi:hypothetical protein
MIVLAVFGFFLGVIGATEADTDKKAFNKTCRLLAITFIVFAIATVIFVLGFIW